MCHRGSEMQILEPWPAALLSTRLDSYCYCCTELEREAVADHFGPKKMLKRYAQRCFLFFSTFALRPQRKHFRRHVKGIMMVKCQYFALGVTKIACQKTPTIIHTFCCNTSNEIFNILQKKHFFLILRRFYNDFATF